MKKFYLLSLLVLIPLFAGQVTLDLAEPLSETARTHVLEKVIPIPFTISRGETLKYDTGVFNNGLGITGGGSTPSSSQTYGFATYFILGDFGISTPQTINSVQVMLWQINAGSDFRIYVWNNVASALLRPESHATHLFSDMAAPYPPVQTWGSWDLTADSIAAPETLWVGVCYNYLSNGAPSDWYLALNQGQVDDHTYINLSGTASAWSSLSGMGYGFPYAVRIVVEDVGGVPDTNDVGTISIDIPDQLPWNTILAPQATVKNFGNVTETFDVTCDIDPGAYTSTENVLSLAPGDSVQVTFTPDFTFATDTYTVTVYTQLPGDMDTSNDTLQKVIPTYDPGIAEGGNIPEKFTFSATTISRGTFSVQFGLPSATTVELILYDALGRLREILVSKRFSAGTHSIDAKLDLPAGVYFYNLKTGSDEGVNGKFVLVD